MTRFAYTGTQLPELFTGAQWQALQKSFVVAVNAPGSTAATWSYLFDVYNTTTSLEFFVDARAVDGFGNVDTRPDGEAFDVEPPP